ncbi:cache domain-containing protein, partial [Actinoplanes sp. NPDC049599]|uniref:cache domain-containing protein n=1 Tax=Actinoplanes sp. NPDC049599 TaxID=3363903 RepID=UPI0037A7DB7D
MTLASAAAEPARDRPGAHQKLGRFVSGLALLAVLIVVPTAAAVVSYDRMVRSNADREMQNTADLADVFLREQNAGLAALMNSVAADAGLAEALSQAPAADRLTTVNRVLRTLSAAGTDISTVVVLDSGERVVGNLPGRVPIGYDLGKQTWFPDISDLDNYSVSAVFRSPVSGFDVTATTVTIHDFSGALVGYVVVSRKITGYQRYVDSYGSGRGVRLSVLDGSGQLVADSEGAAPAGLSRVDRLARGATVLAGSGQIVAASVPTSEAGGYGWRVVAQESKATAMRPAVFFRAVAIGTAAVLL